MSKEHRHAEIRTAAGSDGTWLSFDNSSLSCSEELALSTARCVSCLHTIGDRVRVETTQISGDRPKLYVKIRVAGCPSSQEEHSFVNTREGANEGSTPAHKINENWFNYLTLMGCRKP